MRNCLKISFFCCLHFRHATFRSGSSSESLGRTFFESLKSRDFNTYYRQSIFSLNEETFKIFLQKIRNQSMRDHLIQNHPLPFPEDANNSQLKWALLFFITGV